MLNCYFQTYGVEFNNVRLKKCINLRLAVNEKIKKLNIEE